MRIQTVIVITLPRPQVPLQERKKKQGARKKRKKRIPFSFSLQQSHNSTGTALNDPTTQWSPRSKRERRLGTRQVKTCLGPVWYADQYLENVQNFLAEIRSFCQFAKFASSIFAKIATRFLSRRGRRRETVCLW